MKNQVGYVNYNASRLYNKIQGYILCYCTLNQSFKMIRENSSEIIFMMNRT